jgi:hypothetical protein
MWICGLVAMTGVLPQGVIGSVDSRWTVPLGFFMLILFFVSVGNGLLAGIYGKSKEKDWILPAGLSLLTLTVALIIRLFLPM